MTIHLKNVTVAELLRQIEAQGQYSFAYNNADIDLTRVVSVDAESWPIERIVLKCIPDVFVNVERNKVILTPRRGASGEYCTMGETLMQRRRVEEEGLRIVNSCC